MKPITRTFATRAITLTMLILVFLTPRIGVPMPLFCSCADVSNIIYRIAEAELTIGVYQIELDHHVKPSDPFDYQEYRRIQRNLKNILDARLPGLPGVPPSIGPIPGTSSAGRTDGITCSYVVTTAASACMRESLERHEQVHSDLCATVKTRRPASGWVLGTLEGLPPGEHINFLSYFTLHEMLNNEMQAYSAEIAFLRKQLEALEYCSGSPLLTITLEKFIERLKR